MEKLLFDTEKELFLFLDELHGNGYIEYREEKLSNFDSEKGFVDVEFFIQRKSDGKKFSGCYTRGAQGDRWVDDNDCLTLEEIIVKPTKEKINKADKEHLQWVYNRMVEVHEENKGFDYMIAFQKIIDKI